MTDRVDSGSVTFGLATAGASVGAGSSGVQRTRRHPLLRIRVQLPGGLACAIGLPLLLGMMKYQTVVLQDNVQNTVLAAVIAHLLGYVIYRRLGSFPGTAASRYILPTFAFTYGLVFMAIFFLRLDYNRLQAAGSFSLSVLWYFGLTLITRRLEVYRFAVVPGGNVAGLQAIGRAIWSYIPSPHVSIGEVQGVIADLRADLSDEWERFIADSALSGIPVYHVKQVRESLTGRVEIEHLSENTLGSLNPASFYIQSKRIVDWLMAALLLVPLLPVGLAVALVIRLESPGPALFRQQRMGFRGRVFTCYKFRTMTVNQPAGDQGREAAMTKQGDPRITRIGRWLRRTRIDEIPQIINILRGEMSWIGPRPEALVLSQWYESELPFYRYRHIVIPGITGWAQVSQGHVSEVGDVHEKLQYDFYYIKNFSPWLDILILLRTIETMLTGSGAR
jgi:lipopolysaccharide/colanic/teichoic acid biosynthesis glycosyltransferase